MKSSSKIFYCPKCKATFSMGEKVNTLQCPTCGINLCETNIEVETWRQKTDYEKNALKEEFSRIYFQQSSATFSEGRNTIGAVLMIFGILIAILSIIAGINIASDRYFDGKVGLIVALGGISVALILVGIGEVINLAQDIKNKL